MNETIGVKGGKRDRKRRLIITKNQKKRLREYQKGKDKYELERLEKQVKQIQKETLVKVVPVAIAGQVATTITKTNSSPKEEVLVETKDKLTKLSPSKKEKKDRQEISKNDSIQTKKTPGKIKEEKAVEIKEQKQDSILMPKTEITNSKKIGSVNTPTNNILEEEQETINKLKNRKIIDEYEKKLKEIRTDLRKLVFEYNVVSEESNNLYTSKQAEELLDNLSIIIKKIESLKEKLKIDDLDKYDDSYIYTLIEKYIEEFKDKKFVSEIKDSDLYILISNKLEELDSKKTELNKKVETRKEELAIKEIDFDSLKEKYYNYDKFNNELLRFQSEQDYLLGEIKRKIAEAETVEEKVEVQVQGLNRQSRRLMLLLSAQMMLPGLRGAKSIATLAATYLYFMNNVIQPKTVTKKYKVIKVIDYSVEIETSLKALSDAEVLLKRTSKQIVKMIAKFKSEYSEFFGIIPECNKLLANLEKVKEEVNEREYEVNKIKKEQEKNLEKNNAKVKKIGKYEM